MAGPTPHKTSSEDWLNRIIIAVIALFALIAGVPLTVSGAASVVLSVADAALPTGWDVVLFLLGLVLSGFAGMLLWKVFFGGRSGARTDGDG